MGAFLLFLAGLAVFVVAWLKKVAGQTAALDAADKKVAEAESTVRAKEAAASEAAARAVETHRAVAARLAELEQTDAADRERDTVAVANDIIGRN